MTLYKVLSAVVSLPSQVALSFEALLLPPSFMDAEVVIVDVVVIVSGTSESSFFLPLFLFSSSASVVKLIFWTFPFLPTAGKGFLVFNLFLDDYGICLPYHIHKLDNGCALRMIWVLE
jgi:hypothetical protein